MNAIDTTYVNTDFDLQSPVRFDLLNEELSLACCVLHYTEMTKGTWSASYEADRLNSDAASDITAILEVVDSLSDAAKEQLSQCNVRDFNIGFHCWDSWAYKCSLSDIIIAAIAHAGFSCSITLYPMREPDGTPKIDSTN